MADNLASFAKMARFVAIFQITTGVLLFFFGIADRIASFKTEVGPGSVCYGIWIGIWLCITGRLGISGSERERTTCRNVFTAVFMGFSITSALLGGLIILNYSFWIDVITSYRSNNSSHYHAKFANAIIILILGICALVAGILAAISVCLMNPCNCCAQTWVEQRVFCTNLAEGRYITTQVSGGVPFAVPVEECDDNTVAAWCYQQRVVLAPVSGASGGPYVIVQAASSEGLATGSTQQQVQPPLVHFPPTKAVPSKEADMSDR